MDNRRTLNWKEEYSVNVKEIDEQHKLLFKLINELIEAIRSVPSRQKIEEIIGGIVHYKTEHFATEEKYFEMFKYDKAEEHIAAHKQFSVKVEEIQDKFKDDTTAFAFALVDFLEDWLIDHLLTMDHEYIKCFNDHGLK